MTVSFKPLRSETGFSSPGFLVDELGNFSISQLNTTSAYKINGVEVLSSTALGSAVVNSSLTTLGTLTELTVNAPLDVNLTSAASINLTALSVEVNSTTITVATTGAIVLASGTLGSIDNVSIGSTTPSTGNFTTLTATEAVYVGGQNIKALSAALAVALS